MWAELEANGWNWDLVDENACYDGYNEDYFREDITAYNKMYHMTRTSAKCN